MAVAAEKLERLPKWAQDRIRYLERDLESLREKLREGPEESNTFADPYMNPRPLGQSPVIEFRVDERHTFRVRLEEDGRLYVNAVPLVAIHPQSSNSLHLVAADWVAR